MPIEGSAFAVEVPAPPPVPVPTPAPPSGELLPPPSGEAPPSGQTLIGGNTAAAGLSDWIRYTRPDCCGPIGRHGPIQTELIMYNGPSIPVGGGISNRLLNTGWDVEAGGRSLFFNSEMDSAWTASATLNYIYNHAKAGVSVPLQPRGASPTSAPVQTRVRVFDRDAVSAGLGKELYLYVWPGDDGVRLRAGFDAGGRLGTVKAELVNDPLVQMAHRTDVMYALYTAVHADAEIPHGDWTFLVGVRLEWDHQWMSIWQGQNNSNLQDFNVLLNLGLRY
jgi:hypothetical protein